MKKTTLLAFMLALVLVFASACGSDDNTLVEVTASPEVEETAAPTAEPTEAPTEEPTEAPTEEPTAEPTEAPTEEPTAEPTEAPTEEPAAEPTEEPAAAASEEAESEPAAQAEEAEPVAQAEDEAIGGADGETEIEIADETEEDPVLATAYDGGISLKLSEIKDAYDQMLAYYISYYAQYGYELDEYDTDVQATVAQETVQLEMSQRVAEQFAKDQGYVLTSEKEEELRAQVQTVLDNMREYYESYLSYYGYEGDELTSIVEEELAASGYSEEVLYENACLSDLLDFLYELATQDVTVTEEEVKAAFDAKVAAQQETYADVDAFINAYINEEDILYTPENVRLMQCIYIAIDEDEVLDDVATPDEATPGEATPDEATSDEATPEEATPEEATSDEAALDGTEDETTPAEADMEATPAEAQNIAELAGYAKAKAIVAAIRGGEDFSELMNAYNEDSSTQEQMEKGYPISEDSVLYGDEFKAGAMALEAVGDVSDVIVTDYGYFILCYAQDLTPGEADFESRKEQETEEALSNKKDEIYSEYVDTMIAEANIVLGDLSALYHVYVGETVEATIAYATVEAETELMDMPSGDAVAVMAAGTSLDVLGRIGIDGEEYVFVAVPGTDFKGFINEASMTDMDEEAALAIDNTALVTACEEMEKLPTFTIVMNDGSLIYGELYPDVAPESVGNFISLAQSGFYNGLTFHRVVPGFVIQGGDPNGDGTGGPGYAIRGEFSSNGIDNDLSHTRGVLSMARSSAMDSAGSQFFIMHADNDYLDGDYAAFGMVIGGIETVDLIASVPTNSNDKPMSDQVMREVCVQTYGKTYTFTKLED